MRVKRAAWVSVAVWVAWLGAACDGQSGSMAEGEDAMATAGATDGSPSGPGPAPARDPSDSAPAQGSAGAAGPAAGQPSSNDGAQADAGSAIVGPTDAGSAEVDAASADAGAGSPQPDASAGAQGCAGGDYLICEDFETTEAGAIPEGWTVRGDASVVSVTDEQAHGGSRALWLGPIPFWERRIARDASSLPSAHWGRIFYRVQLPVPDAFVHSTLVALQGNGPLSGAAEYRVVDTVKAASDAQGIENRHHFLYNVQPQSSGEFGHGTGYDWQFDGQWHCAEWHVDAATQSYLFYRDGAELIRIENGAGNYADMDLPDGFEQLRIGWNNYQEAPPGFTAWLDDLAIDDERIGCE